MRDTAQRFSGRVENYVKYRPAYPNGVLELLQTRCGLTDRSVVADIGSGTGIFSKLLLRTGCKLFGIEPNREMREAAENLLADEPGFMSLDARAEDTKLPRSSVDLITSAQAFHWFDRRTTKAEFKRIARPGAWLILVWNTRLSEGTPFLMAYETLLHRCSIDYSEVDQRNVTPEMIADFFAPAAFETAVFSNSQSLDLAGLVGRTLSASYTPHVGEPRFAQMMEGLQELFKAHEAGGQIEFLYRTIAYFGKFRSLTDDSDR